ncbi:helix-turn-helix transcriptional regulator [Streptomyces sp. G5(2025)]|uniref:helix-turn-helix transcriptional regulator n=1 Tax=Streptomyces sp. G5(2025) TaxID=3406628 RepID=UPI003C177030
MRTERRRYLVAWDLERADWRTFRVDRLTPKPPHGPRCAPRTPPADDHGRVRRRGRLHPRVRRARRGPPPRAAGGGRRADPPADGTLEAETERSCLLRTGAASLDVMLFHVMFLGLEFEVVEPAELTERIRVARNLLTRALDRGAPSDPGASPDRS